MGAFGSSVVLTVIGADTENSFLIVVKKIFGRISICVTQLSDSIQADLAEAIEGRMVPALGIRGYVSELHIEKLVAQSHRVRSLKEAIVASVLFGYARWGFFCIATIARKPS